MRARLTLGCQTSWRWMAPPGRIGAATPRSSPVPVLDGAGANRRQVDDDELVPVGKLDQHAVAAVHAQPSQLRREAIRLTPGLSIGETADAIGHQLAIGRLLGPAVQAIEQTVVFPPAVLPEPRSLLRGVTEADAGVFEFL